LGAKINIDDSIFVDSALNSIIIVDMLSANKKFNLRYTFLREYFRWVDKLSNWNLKRRKTGLAKRHQTGRTFRADIPNVYIHNYGYEWIHLSSIQKSFEFNWVDDPAIADAVVFITIVDEGLNLENKNIFIFYTEPEVYTKVHFNKLSHNFFKKNRVTVITHHPDPAYFLTPTGPFKFIRSIIYTPFLHGAIARDLSSIDGRSRNKKVFTITSALSGIAGNDNKKKYIEKLIERGSELDVYGRFSRAAYSVKNYRGTCAYKYKLLSKYRYNLILENSPDEDWYVTEKIYDALLCGCMPIFHGSRRIYELFPAKWFYHLPSFEDHELDRLEEFMKTDAYLIVANNRKEIADYIDKNFSFFSAIDKVVNHRLVEFTI